MSDHYKELMEFCQTDKQRRVLEEVSKGTGITGTAKKLGVDRRNVQRILRRIEKLAKDGGHQPHMEVVGACNQIDYDEEGNGVVKRTWQRVKKNQDKSDLREFVDSLLNEVTGESPVVPKYPAPDIVESDLMTVYPIVDHHLGMLSWRKETGEDYDYKIAEGLLCRGIDQLVAAAPASEIGIVANLGDFFHFDNDEKRTRRSGNTLDGDTRWAKIVRVGVGCLKYAISQALLKHPIVRVINSVGNHDEQTALMLPIILEAYYDNNPRVEIDVEPRNHHYYRFGNNLLGFHHGHTTKMEKLPYVMMADRTDMSTVPFRHWLTGHIHHQSAKDIGGCLIESFRTLAARDAWHANEGYRSLRDMQSITYHREYGEIGRNRASLRMIEDEVDT